MRTGHSLRLVGFALLAASALHFGCGVGMESQERTSGQDVTAASELAASGKADEHEHEYEYGDKEEERVAICHVPPRNDFVLLLPESAIPGHLGHGDCLCSDPGAFCESEERHADCSCPKKDYYGK